MARKPLSDFKKEFVARVKQARVESGLSQEKMAKALGLPQGKYKHYEVSIYLPRDLVEQFCLVAGVNTTWLLTGEGPKRPERPALRIAAGAGDNSPPRSRRPR